MLEFDENGMVNRKKMSYHERLIFILFLESEKVRHNQDIVDIDKTIEEMKKLNKQERLHGKITES